MVAVVPGGHTAVYKFNLPFIAFWEHCISFGSSVDVGCAQFLLLTTDCTLLAVFQRRRLTIDHCGKVGVNRS